MKIILVVLLIALFFNTILAEKKRYDGYQVFRVDVRNQTDQLIYIAETLMLDIWASNKVEGWVDVMVPPSKISEFTEVFKKTLYVSDVQSMLDEHEAEMMKSHKGGHKGAIDHFPTTGEAVAWLNEQIAAHPQVASRFILGESYLGNDILGIRLASDSSKPIIFIHCTIHAREWITTTSCLWIIDSLLNLDPDGYTLISEYQWYIVPILNVDGYDYTHTTDRLWRKNRAPNSGSTCAGTDLNRNFAYGWGGPGSSNNPCSETFRGSSAFSTPEISSLRDFIKPLLDEGRVAVYMDVHSYGGYFASVWAYTNALPPDYDRMEEIMISATDAMYLVNGRTYVYGASSEIIYISSGASKDWVYGDSGVIASFSIECIGNSFTAPISAIPLVGREIYAAMKDLAEQGVKKEYSANRVSVYV